MPGVFLWGYDGTDYRQVLVDAAGRLIVVTAAGVGVDTHCHGYDGAAWQELLVESAANANLRTRLYDGVNPVVSVRTAVDIADTNRGLFTQAGVRGWDGTFWKSVNVEDGAGDALTNARASLSSLSKLYGYNGATWDRLRVMTPADAFVTPTMALQVSSFLMGYDGGDWNMVRVDAAGHLQIDVLSSTLPALAATAANQVLINANLATLVTEQGRCYGYDGSNWQTLIVESSTHKNLRVRLYVGATGLSSATFGIHYFDPSGLTALTTSSQMMMRRTATEIRSVFAAQAIGDADGGYQSQGAFLWGWNGSSWDRLRTWGTGVLKVGRAEIDSTTVRLTAAGPVVAGAHNLYWVACSPSAPNAQWELTDAIAALGAIVYDHFDTDRESEHLTFDPPMKFTTGIYVETFTNMTSLVFCYV